MVATSNSVLAPPPDQGLSALTTLLWNDNPLEQRQADEVSGSGSDLLMIKKRKSVSPTKSISLSLAISFCRRVVKEQTSPR